MAVVLFKELSYNVHMSDICRSYEHNKKRGDKHRLQPESPSFRPGSSVPSAVWSRTRGTGRFLVREQKTNG